MRVRDILKHIDLEKMPSDLLRDIVQTMKGTDARTETADFKEIMYSDPNEDANLRKIEAEISKLRADARRSAAEVCCRSHSAHGCRRSRKR